MNITFRKTDDLPFAFDARRQIWLQDDSTNILHSIDTHRVPSATLGAKLSTQM